MKKEKTKWKWLKIPIYKSTDKEVKIKLKEVRKLFKTLGIKIVK